MINIESKESLGDNIEVISGQMKEEKVRKSRESILSSVSKELKGK